MLFLVYLKAYHGEKAEANAVASYQNYQNGAVSNQLTDIGRERVCWGGGGRQRICRYMAEGYTDSLELALVLDVHIWYTYI
jgi:hypothetical protein